MYVHEHVELECVFCGHDRPHELLYLSGQMKASRCEVCGHVLVFSGPLQEEHAVDIFKRSLRLPEKLKGELTSRPLSPLVWPMKALRKPFRLLMEARRVEAFQEHPTGRRAFCGRGGEAAG